MTLAEEEALSTFHEVGSKYIYPHHLVNSKRLTSWYFVGTVWSPGAITDVGSDVVEELKNTLPQRRRKSSFGGAAIAREKAALTFDLLINFAERQPAEHCPQEQEGHALHPAMLERNTQPNPS